MCVSRFIAVKDASDTTKLTVQKLPCTFTLDVPGLGYLESNTDADLHAGAKVELPMWLGPTLCVK